MLFWHWRSLLNHLNPPSKFRCGWRGASSCLSRGGLKRVWRLRKSQFNCSQEQRSLFFFLFSLFRPPRESPPSILWSAQAAMTTPYTIPRLCVSVCVPCLGELRWDSLISSASIRQRSNSSAMRLNSTESDLLISFFRCHSVLCLVAKDSWRGAEFFCLSSTDATFSAVGCRAFNLPDIPHEVKLCWTFQSLFCYYKAEFWNQKNGCNFGTSTRPSSLNTRNMSC